MPDGTPNPLGDNRSERTHELIVPTSIAPARVVVYYVLAMALFSDASYEEVMRQLVEGLAWESGWERAWAGPSKAAISRSLNPFLTRRVK